MSLRQWRRFGVLLVAVLVVGCLFLPSAAMADADGPYVQSLAPGDGMQTSVVWTKPAGGLWQKQLQFVAVVDDPDGISSSGQQMYISGVGTITAAVEYVVGTYETQARIKYTRSNPAVGMYTARVAAKDKLGNTSVHGWAFTATNGPCVNAHTPGRNELALTPTSPITATLAGGTNTSGLTQGTKIAVNAASIVMKVDGVTVTPSLSWIAPDNKWCTVSYTPGSPLSDGTHLVELSFRNASNVTATYSYQFTSFASQPALIDRTSVDASGCVLLDADGSFTVTADAYDAEGLSALDAQFTLTAPDDSETTVAPTFVFTPGTARRTARLTARFPCLYEDSTLTLTARVKDSAGNTGTKTWQLRTPLMPPVFDARYPFPTATMRTFAVSERVRDFGSGVDPASIRLTIDGSLVSHDTSAVPGGFVVYYDRQGAYADNSTHSVALSAADTLGTPATDAWSFTVSASPQASMRTPAPGSTLAGEDTTISVRLTEVGDGVRPSSIVMRLDGDIVTPTVTPSGEVTAAVATLSLPVLSLATGSHTVVVEADDGHVPPSHLTDTWTFTSEAPSGDAEMPLNTNEPCKGCHVGLGDYTKWDQLHWVVGDRQDADWNIPSSRAAHRFNCNVCHYSAWDPAQNEYVGQAFIPQLFPCALCHPAAGIPPVVTGPHGGSGSTWFDYRWRDHDDPEKYDRTAPTEGRDCIYCHQGPKGAQRIDDFANNGTFPAHDLVANHRVEFPAGSAGCSGCHSSILTREHADAVGHIRRSDEGGVFDCASCHEGQDSSVEVSSTKVLEVIRSYPPLRYRFWGPIDSPWRTWPVPPPPGTEQAYAFLVDGSNEEVDYLNDVGEYVVSDKLITGGRVRLVNSTLGTFTVEAYYPEPSDEATDWHSVYSARIGGADDGAPGGNLDIDPFPTYPSDLQTFSCPPAEKVRIRYESDVQGYHYVYGNVDNWQFSDDDVIDCFDCHVGVLPHGDADPLTHTAQVASDTTSGTWPAPIATGQPGAQWNPPYVYSSQCGECHDMVVSAEHTRTASSSAGDGCDNCHPTPRDSVGTWGKTCVEAGCHPPATSTAQHSSISAIHGMGLVDVQAGCGFKNARSGPNNYTCHYPDLVQEHNRIIVMGGGGYYQIAVSCAQCHTSTEYGSLNGPWNGQCVACHPGNHTVIGSDRYAEVHAKHDSPYGYYESEIGYAGSNAIDAMGSRPTTGSAMPSSDSGCAATTCHTSAWDYPSASGYSVSCTECHYASVLPVTPHAGSYQWSSGYRDYGSIDRSLTSSTLPTLGAGAYLDFATWYEMEIGWDYCYVEVSTNGGTTWSRIPGSITTTANPNGANLGNGITGPSGGWVNAHFDLSGYAGSSIRVRFRCRMDSMWNYRGWKLDQIVLGDANGVVVSDGAETLLPVWMPNGWTRNQR